MWMSHHARQRATAAFTLVELLIVILIIGTLAAVAIPQFGDAAADAKVAALDQNLATVRKAIDKYHVEHGDAYPGKVAVHERVEGAGSVLLAHSDFVDAFTKQMTMYSNAAGNTTQKKDERYPYGPYLRTGVPPNPLPAAGAAGAEAAVAVTNDPKPLRAQANATSGWRMSSETGQFIANNALYDTR
jgi:prepilin-type N-terminal cleavage/methylation domain-containing protein